MIKISCPQIEFDQSRLEKKVQIAKNLVLRSCGAYVRKIARDFVKHKANPNKASEPGDSPYDHFGLKRSIQFALHDKNTVVIGPRLIRDGLANVARRHEFGGTAQVKKIDFNLLSGVKVGDEAPVTASRLTNKDSVIKAGATDGKTGQRTYWIKIRTKRQAESSTRLYRRMAKDVTETETITYPPRPYMRPALNKSLPYLNRIMRNSLNKIH